MKKERAGLRLKLLGGFETRLATGAPVTLPTRKAQGLLAYLAVRPGQTHPRDKLASLLWPDRGESQARDSLRHTLVELRKILPARPPSLTAEGRAVVLDPAAIDIDVVRFETLLEAGTVDDLTRAAEMYQGEFLEGFVLREPAFEEWLVAERERLRERALDALRRLLEQQRKGRAIEPAIRTALRLLALDATQEVAHRALITARPITARRWSSRGMRPLIAHCHLGLGKLYRRTSKRSEAEQHLGAATAMYRDLEMPFYLDQAHVELRHHFGQ